MGFKVSQPNQLKGHKVLPVLHKNEQRCPLHRIERNDPTKLHPRLPQKRPTQMKWAPAFAVLFIAPMASLLAIEAPSPESPATGSVVYSPHPHFRWQREKDVRIDAEHRIQIGRSPEFKDIVCDERVEVVSRFVSANPLAPSTYWWRVSRGEGDWSPALAFEVRTPENHFTVRLGSDSATVARVLQEAAEHCPALVDFEPGEYHLAPVDGKSVVTLAKTRDLIIDGHGATLVLEGTLLVLNDAQRVTLRRFTVKSSDPGHTLVRVTKKDPAAGSVTVQAEPGYHPEVSRYFSMEGSGGSFLACMDPQVRGKYLIGAGISARTVRVRAAADEAGAFVFSPVKAETLALVPTGGVAVVTSYRWQWVQMNRTEECTFSDVTVSDLPGAFCGGGNNSARSLLACKIIPRSPQDYFGGHSHTSSGRIGEWIEGCEFQYLPDDGPAQQSFRQPVKGVVGADTILVGGSAVRQGDRIALVNGKNSQGVRATAKEVNGARIALDRPLKELLAFIGRDVSSGLENVFLYCDSQSNEDFVYRRNRHVGGRAHGVKFNGTRAWIAGNHFENLNGNAVLAGYTSEVSGHGAQEVVVTDNTIVRCGWTPITIWSTSGLGGNIIIRGNRVRETRDAAVAIKGCDGVSLLNNEFSSTTVPKQGAWITAEKTKNLSTSGNTYTAEVPELKTAP